MKVVVGAASDVGRARERNEDSYLAMAPVYIVADGMGGHRGGNVASSLAMEVMSGLANGGSPQMLAEQVRAANHAILERAAGDRELQGMGTTITAAYIQDGTVHLAQVGDSRAYLLRAGQFQQVTTDHTLVHEMVKRQQITPQEAEHHPQRSILTRALGVDEPVEVDEFDIPAQVGDRLLLCSDGLHSMVEDEVIHQVLQTEPTPQGAADRLVALANEAGGLDNVTVVIMQFDEGEGFEGATWVPEAADRGATKELTTVPIGGVDDVTAAYQIPAGVAVGGPAAPGQAPPMPEGAETAPPNPATAAGKWPTPAPGSEGAPRKKRRLWIWIAAIVGVLVLLAVGLRLYLDSRFFVGVEQGQVAVFRGVPDKFVGIKMFGLVKTEGLAADKALACAKWVQPLTDGQTAGSQQDAEAIVAQIKADVASGGAACAVVSGGTSGGNPSSSPT
ncbi:MAG TPA: Stp1/IreP family PP2C-type Ser/Thr phosphatase [Actinomycetota bacterium]|nr:Stp1/IreP family PP2C-type Ser/Thr phosphatase [Actinomycetota bacterium]